MSTIDGYGPISSQQNTPIRYDTDVDSVSNDHKQVMMGADDRAYLKMGGTTVVPAFAGTGLPDQQGQAKGALQTMHQTARADFDGFNAKLRETGDIGPVGGTDDNSGINYAALFETLVRLFSEQAKASNEARTYGYQALAEQQKSAAADTRKAAVAGFVGGICSATFTVVAGATNVAGGARGMTAGEAMGAEPNVEMESETNAVGNSEAAAGEKTEASTSLENNEMGTAMSTEGPEGAPSAAESEEVMQADEQQFDEIIEQTDKPKQAEDNSQKLKLDKKSEQIMKSFSRDARINASAQKSQAVMGIYGGVSTGLQGIGGAMKSTGELVQGEYQAKAEEDRAIATEMQASVEREREFGQNVEQTAKKMMEIFDAVQQSRNESMQRAVTV